MDYNKEQFKTDLFSVLAKLSDTPATNIKPTDRLMEDLMLDSLNRMEALSRVADQYDLDPDLDKVMGVKTVQDVLDVMDQAQ